MAKGKFTGGKNIQPGEVRNPHGRPRLGLTDECKMIAKKELVQAMCDGLGMSVEKLEALVENPKASVAMAFVGKILSVGIAKGCPTRAALIFNHILGRPPEFKPDEGEDQGGKMLELLRSLPVEILVNAAKVHYAAKASPVSAG